ncbi:phosphoserine phosphatase SerB [Humidisolicoccus flavus]|uniref:phosphoserine phosphatase SerB n=1 Tax=Humidisolicoccus flavus TaxID=3111414 RepID=UPI00325421A6
MLVLLDVDSTLIENEVIELLAEAAGPEALAHVAEVTERAMRGELDFAESLAERLRSLKGLPESTIAAAADEVRVTDGVAELIEAVHAQGGTIAAVSGGFHEILDGLGERLGLDRWSANRLEIHEGTLTGRSRGPIIDSVAKAEYLEALALELGLPRHRTIAIGDGANDIAMMRAAGLSVSFCGKPAARAAANICVDVPSMRELLPILRLVAHS